MQSVAMIADRSSQSLGDGLRAVMADRVPAAKGWLSIGVRRRGWLVLCLTCTHAQRESQLAGLVVHLREGTLSLRIAVRGMGRGNAQTREGVVETGPRLALTRLTARL